MVAAVALLDAPLAALTRIAGFTPLRRDAHCNMSEAVAWTRGRTQEVAQ
jgi:hypothetical protein